ncbi:MAG: hypothetical protein GY707_05305 [Desulfobacteraceae bacterium]|nr:hypothetical protein [Desulfobacteraceae bacterium]
MDKRIAVVTKTDQKDILTDYVDFHFDHYYLTDSKEKKILKKDIDLDMTLLEPYDFVILIGAEPAKFVANIGSVLKFQGYLVEDKWLPLTNPKMLKFNPAGAGAFEKAIQDIKGYITGTVKNHEAKVHLIQDEEQFNELLDILESDEPDILALDTETSGLAPRDGYVLGMSLTWVANIGYYVDADYITDEQIDRLQLIINKTKHVVFHNAKFDIHMLQYHFGLLFNSFDDSMLLHYCLNELAGTHGLKELAIKYTDLGDYEHDLDVFKKDYCKKTGLKVGEFTYDLFPFDILGTYAALDTVATYALFVLFYDKVKNSKKLWNVYNNILIPGTKALLVVEENGVPFCRDQLSLEKEKLDTEISVLEKEIYNFDVIHEFEKRTGKLFNSNSVAHKREILFDMLGLESIGKKTGTGALSVDAEVMADLAKQHALPALMGKITKAKKIKNTYIDKIILALDSDSRLRTGFHLQTTTSGRLSSSGKMNMQTMPRDNKAPKRSIKAREGYKIISGDLGTAEMYIVSVLSGDPVLQGIFKNGEDYHSMIAKYKFDLPYSDKEIQEFHSDLRQEAKTTSFEILYKLNLNDPILKRFKVLKKWLENQRDTILNKGYIYQFFGRKRRLPNVFSSDRQVRDHEVRSGVNSLVQGPSSDINLLACIDLVNYIKENNMKAKVFAMVHDSILAEVPDDEVVHYSEKLKEFMQTDRGLSIPGTPVKVDIEIGSSYALEDKKEMAELYGIN